MHCPLQEEHHYHTTKFPATSTSNAPTTLPTSGPLPEYSELDKGKKKKNNDYQHLREFEDKSNTPRSVPVQNSADVYSHLEQGTSDNTGATNSRLPGNSLPQKSSRPPNGSQPRNTTSAADDKKLLKINPPP